MLANAVSFLLLLPEQFQKEMAGHDSCSGAVGFLFRLVWRLSMPCPAVGPALSLSRLCPGLLGGGPRLVGIRLSCFSALSLVGVVFVWL